MCHSDDSRPPAPPVVGATSPGESLELVASDGNHLAAYEVLPEGPARAGVVVLPDVRGLHPYYLALAERFAQAGLAAVSIDYYGRTDGVAVRNDSFDWQSRVAGVTKEHVTADVGAAVARLSQVHGVTDVFTVGFCMGGGNSWRMAATDLPLRGTIGFYGRPAALRREVDQVHLPLLMLIAGADAGIPLEDSMALYDNLRAAGAPAEAHVYDGAPHSFFDRSFDEWAGACDDAWVRMLDFVDRFRAAA